MHSYHHFVVNLRSNFVLDQFDTDNIKINHNYYHSNSHAISLTRVHLLYSKVTIWKFWTIILVSLGTIVVITAHKRHICLFCANNVAKAIISKWLWGKIVSIDVWNGSNDYLHFIRHIRTERLLNFVKFTIIISM